MLEHPWLKDAENQKEVFVREFKNWQNSLAQPISFSSI